MNQVAALPPQWLKKAKVLILDLDGTIYLGGRLFPFTQRSLQEISDSGRRYVFFTNNSSRSVTDYREKLASMGVKTAENQLYNATQVLLEVLQQRQTIPTVFVVGTQSLQKEFSRAGFQCSTAADLVVLGFDTELTYDKVKTACDLIRQGVPVVGINPDLNCPVENGFLPDCGSIAALITASTAVKVEFYGKPSRSTLEFLLRKTGVREEELIFVGDRLYTDIAITEGSRAHSVLVYSGETKKGSAENSQCKPDLACANLAELTALLKKADG
ncbi:MAG: HAD-IIA family hydrolase [Negativicutes bacterium]|nr:HAD-IIA family hydrolase [Negativicutes bacterium]